MEEGMIQHVGHVTGEIHKEMWCGNPKERDHLKDLGVDV
jgi:hypothetical protein